MANHPNRSTVIKPTFSRDFLVLYGDRPLSAAHQRVLWALPRWEREAAELHRALKLVCRKHGVQSAEAGEARRCWTERMDRCGRTWNLLLGAVGARAR